MSTHAISVYAPQEAQSHVVHRDDKTVVVFKMVEDMKIHHYIGHIIVRFDGSGRVVKVEQTVVK